MKYCFFLLATFGFFLSCTKEESNDREPIAAAMEKSIKTELLNKWYPQSRDTVYGGFFSTYTYDFQLTGPQNKMIVTQGRHV